MSASGKRRAASVSTQPLRTIDRPLVVAALLAVAVMVVYLQVLRFDFVLLDDPVYVSGNKHVQAGLTLQNLKWCFAEFHDANWVPLTWLSLMLDTELYGVSPGGYHATNVLMHVVNTLLLFAVIAQATQNGVRSGVVAALFALHPLHVESVAWIAERKDVLSTLFGLLSLLAYVRYANRGRLWSLAISWICFVCSLMSKQTLVTLPFVFLLLDFWPLRRLGLGDPEQRVGNRLLASGSGESESRLRDDPANSSLMPSVIRLIVEKLPFLAVSAAFSVIAVFAQGSEQEALASLTKYSLATRCMNAVVVYVAYLRKTLVPYDLAVFYPHPGAALTWTAVVAAAAILVVISLISIVWVRKFPFLFVGWAWYLGTLVPTIGIVQIGGQQMADRYTYFPLIGLFLAFVWLVPALVPDGVLRRRVVPGTALAALGLFAAATFVQIGYWRDSVTLYRHAIECAPNEPFMLSSLGYALVLHDEVPEGLSLLDAAVRIPPPSAKTHFGLAMAYQRLARADEAAAEYEAALALDDYDPEAHNNLAVILSGRRKYEEAKRHLLRAIEVKPNYAQSYVNLGVLSAVTGQYADAITYSQQALELDPLLISCHYTIALALRSQGRLDEAVSQYRYLVQVSPDDRQARLELARTLAMKRSSTGH
jgi:tetratricopeptide (TPR) repeat protein